MHKQFSRPSVTVNTVPTANREWRTVHAGTLSVGDIVPDFGKIEKVSVYGGAIMYTNPSGAVRAFGWSDPIFAFTEARAITEPSPAPEPFGA